VDREAIVELNYEIQNFPNILLPAPKKKTRRSLHANTSGQKAQDNKPQAFRFVARGYDAISCLRVDFDRLRRRPG
jgi:hypothetical protein